jgi:hypothetical protein
MRLACPHCGTRDARISRPRGLVQRLKGFVGISALRCRRCSNRWETSVWSNGSWKYARCPQCYRQELTKWTIHRYNPPRWTRFLLRLGAAPRRCPACRCNFASFKPQKESFSWNHQVRAQPLRGTSDKTTGAAREQTPPVEGSGEQMP